MARTITRYTNRGSTAVPSIFSADPFGRLRDEFDNMLSNWFTGPESGSGMPNFSPMLDMSETGSNYEVKVDLPGVQADEVNVQIVDNVLTISGERRYEKADNTKGNATPHFVERYHGSFSRSVILPAAVKQDQVDAQFHNGVLTITLPKAEEVKPCHIPVKS
jgi:HSP20 family protein